MLKNFSYLSAINLVNLAFPLFIIPILLEKLGKNNYGMFVTGVALAQFFSVFIKLSFDLLGARDIALNKNNAEQKSKIYHSINLAKNILFGLCFFLYIGFLELYYDLDATQRWVFYLAYIINISDIYYASWYFQGIEKMQNITIIGFVQKIIYLLGIIFLVHQPQDIVLLMMLQGISIVLVSFISNQLVLKDCLKASRNNLAMAKVYTKEALPLSLPSFINMFKERIGYIVISKYLGSTMVTYYDIADKIRQVISMPFTMINQVVYPKVAVSKSAAPYQKFFFGSILASLFIVAALYFGIDFALDFYKNGDFKPASHVIKVLGSTCILTAACSFVSTFLIPLDLKYRYYEIFYLSFVLSVIHLLLIWLMNWHSIEFVIYGTLFVNIVNALHFCWVIYHHRLFKASTPIINPN